MSEPIQFDTSSWLTVFLERPLDPKDDLRALLGAELPDLQVSQDQSDDAATTCTLTTRGRRTLTLYKPHPPMAGSYDPRHMPQIFDPGAATLALPSVFHPLDNRRMLGDRYPPPFGPTGELRVLGMLVRSLVRQRRATGIMLNKANFCVKPVDVWLAQLDEPTDDIPYVALLDWGVAQGPAYATFGMVTFALLNVRTSITSMDSEALDQAQRGVFYACAKMAYENRLLVAGEELLVPSSFNAGARPFADVAASCTRYRVADGTAWLDLVAA